MGTLWYGDNATLGLVLAEAAASLAANSQRAQDRIEKMAQAGSLSSRDVATVLMDSAQQNYDIAMSFHEIFISRGMTMEADMALAWASDNSAKATYLMSALADAEQDSDLNELTIATLAGIDSVDNLVGKNFATAFKKTFKILDALYTVRDLRDAWSDGDATKIAAISVSWTAGLALGALAAAAVGAAGFVGGAAVVVLGMLSGIAAVAVDLTKDGVDALLEAIPGVQEDEADAAIRVRNAITQTGTSGTRYIGFDLVFGDEENGVEVGGNDNPNSIAGGLGDDLLYGGVKDDYLAGGDGADILRAEDGDDAIRGGGGADILEGGKGSDRLEGGAGFDVYQFSSSDFNAVSEDVILDSDGVGKITFDNIAIGDLSVNGVSRDGLGWETQDRQFRLQVVGSGDSASLIITYRENGSRIIVKNWSNGDLSITLPGLGQPGTPENPFPQTNGDDLVGHDGDPEAVHSGNDFISGLAGNDGIDGGYGDDWIDGGHGNDLVLGGPGSNRLIGGLGDDVLMGMPVVMNWSISASPQQWNNIVEGVAGAGLLTKGNGWFSFVEGGAAVAGDATQNLAGFNVGAVGQGDGNPDTDDSPWILLDPNVLPNGDDQIDAGEGSDVAYGGEGDDSISGGIGNDLLLGGSDNDYISGEDGDDVILGDDLPGAGGIWDWVAPQISSQANPSGNDVLIGGAGSDKIYGQGGNDVIDGGAGDDVLQGDRLEYGMANSYEPTGMAGNDYIDGGEGNDDIRGDGGNDTLMGGAGSDFIIGDSVSSSSLIPGSEYGADTIHGGADNDTLVGQGGDDTLYGDDGDDLLLGDGSNSIQIDHAYQGNDSLYGGAGDDQLQGGGGNDYLNGGDGQDNLVGEDGDDNLQGGTGTDQMWGGEGNDSLFGGKDGDELSGEAGDDYLSGDDGNDKLYGGEGNDRLSGGSGDDQIALGVGNDTADGGDGNDILNGNEGADVLTGGNGDDNISGNAENDTLRGDDGNDQLYGDEGSDVIHGGIGADILDGGVGNDTLDGGEGNDRIDGGSDDDRIIAGEGNDDLAGGNGNDTYLFERGFGEDRVYIPAAGWRDTNLDTYLFGDTIASTDVSYSVEAGNLVISVNGTADRVSIEDFFLPQGNHGTIKFADGAVLTRDDILAMFGSAVPVAGGSGNDTLLGSSGADNLHGLGGNDVLDGAGGDDYLAGGSGDDTLHAGTGNDVLEGGEGKDTYLLEAGFGTDRLILSSQTAIFSDGPSADRIVFGASLSRTDAQMTVSGDDLIIAFNGPGEGGDIAYLENFLIQGAGHSIEFNDGVIWTASEYGYGNPINGTSESDHIDGTPYNDRIYGGVGDDVITGHAGDDRIYGEAGHDIAYGGAGNDLYYDVEEIYELAGEGVDTVILNGSPVPYNYIIPDNIENIDYYSTGTAPNGHTIVGNSLDNTLTFRYYGSMKYPGKMDGGSGADHYVFITNMKGDGLSGRVVTINIDDPGDTWKSYYTDVYQYGLLFENYYAFSIHSTLASDFTFDSTVKEFRTLSDAAIRVFGDEKDNIIYADGNPASNELRGGAGDDTYYVDPSDIIVEASAGGVDTVMLGSGASITYLLAENVENLSSGRSGSFQGNAQDNRMSFEGGSYGPGGSLYGGAGNDVLRGGSQASFLYGGTGNDVLSGGSGVTADTLDGGEGNDAMAGGRGSDIYFVDSIGDVITEYKDSQYVYDNDVIYSSVDYSLSDNVERLELLTGAVIATGNAQENTLVGNDAANVLNGKQGTDRLYGGLGADTYIYNAGDGFDNIYETENEAGVVDVLKLGEGIGPNDVQVRRTVANGTHVLIGGQRISFSDGIDYSHAHDLEEASRVEQIHFFDGTIWNVEDVVQVNAPPVVGEPIPWQEATKGQPYSFTLPAGLFVNEPEESLTLQVGGLPDWLTFDAQTKTFAGTPPSSASGFVSISITATDSWGQAAVAYLTLSAYTEMLGTEAADTLVGSSDLDRIYGLGGNDVIDGGAGDDVMIGGAGDDIYTVSSVGDRVVEMANDGNDLVNAAVSHVLADNVERLTLIGSSSIDGTGNAMGNTLTGNSKANTLVGLEGNDTLDGKGGADTMFGGSGDDTYIVDSTADSVTELADEGVDTVRSSVAYVLGDYVENLVLTGSGSVAGAGNALGNTLTGNSGGNALRGFEGDDYIDGGSGNDTMIGGAGDDTYVVGSSGDVVTELADEGYDSVRSSVTYTLSANVESLILTGTSAVSGTGNGAGNTLVGNSGNNSLSGLAGDDWLEGKGGADTLSGGAGNDVYIAARTYGVDTVVENDATSGNRDEARFLAGVAFDQLWFRRPANSNNLEVSIIGTSDKLVIKDWYLGSQYRIEEIRTQDGNKVLLAADVQTLVTAMAGMTAPAQGQTSLTAAQRASLEPVFASTWRDAPQGFSATNTSASMRMAGPASLEVPSVYGSKIQQGVVEDAHPFAREDILLARSVDDLSLFRGAQRIDRNGRDHWSAMRLAGSFEGEQLISGPSLHSKGFPLPDVGNNDWLAQSASNCHGLIAAMSLLDRPAQALVAGHVTERPYTLFP